MKLLIIEDDKELLNALSRRLQEESFNVDKADDGEKGSYLARTNDYDLIILDRTLPKKNGMKVCSEIRGTNSSIPILVLSASIDTDSKVTLLNAGADDYITKPFSFTELIARIYALLRRPKKMENTILKVGDLSLDTRTQVVARGKKRIYLTKKEFSLLEFFIKNKTTVLSRAMIMEHVWNADGDPFSNTIEAHIMNLRKKIRGGNRKMLIHNVPGRGYKIEQIDETDKKVTQKIEKLSRNKK